MGNFQNENSGFSGRLSGATPQPTRPDWSRHSRQAAFAAGFVWAGISIVVFNIVDIFHVADVGRSWKIIVIGVFGIVPPILLADWWLSKRRVKIFDKEFWLIVGCIIGAAVFLPLIVTPRCGWNADKCPPAHNQHKHN